MESIETLQTKLKEATQALADQKEALRQTEEFLESVLGNSREMIFRTNSDGALVFFSKGGESALGYRFEEVSGREIKDLAEDSHGFESLAFRCVEKKEVVREEIKTSVRHIGEQTERCRNITGQLLGFVRESKLTTTSLDAHELLKGHGQYVDP